MVEGGADLELEPVQLVDESGRVGTDLPRCCADAVAGHGLRLLRSKPIMELGSALRLIPRAGFALAVASNYRRV